MGKNKKFQNQFKIIDLKSRLNNLDPMTAYSFSKRKQPSELANVLSLLPPRYVKDLNNKIHSVDFIYSGSTEQPFILGMLVGRLDTFQGKETYDIDLFHIAPESGSIDDYFMNQFHHVKDDNGDRVSIVLNCSLYSSSIDRENQLYNIYLTGSTSGKTFEEYEREKPDFIKLFKNSFK
jgi:hypothetical protein